MRRFIVHDTPLEGLKVIERIAIEDTRGYLERLFCHEELKEVNFSEPIRQINRTLTKRKGTVRGLHFQYPPFTETKIVSCLKGTIWDVAVDLRANSRTFLQHFAQELSEANRRSLLIPKGFAHGFQTLTDDCELLYFHTTDYKPTAEGALDALDPKLSIDWPNPIVERSQRDRSHPMLSDPFEGLQLS